MGWLYLLVDWLYPQASQPAYKANPFGPSFFNELALSCYKRHRSWISSGSIVDNNSVPAILTKNLDCQSFLFWMKLNIHRSDSQKTFGF